LIRKKKSEVINRWTHINSYETGIGLSMSLLKSHREEMKKTVCEFEIWDEKDADTLVTNKGKLN